MTLKPRIVKLERIANVVQERRYVIQLIGDESLEEAKAAKAWEDVPDDELFIIHRVFL